MTEDTLVDDTKRLHDLLKDYQVGNGVADELFDRTGQIRPVWAPFIQHLRGLSADVLEEHFARGESYLRDAGVYFRHYTDDQTPDQDWPLSSVPVLIHESEWDAICVGLEQRANLLELVMADLYGPGALVSGGYLPAELIAQNAAWLRPMVGVKPASGHYLHLLSFEISRNPDGSWFVLGDRTQAPAGAGFALENRMATNRIFNDLLPQTHIRRLSSFFREFRDRLDVLSMSKADHGRRAAILTPGPNNASYFEHLFVARYLGLLLLEGEDLIVQNGEVKVRTVAGLEPIGVLWRRLDAEFSDPLELMEHSQLGTPGLVNALRLGKVNMINALGSGVLEMRAMLAFLPRISEALTGEALRLPNLATWWCGQKAAREYVKSNSDRMMIGAALAQDLPFDLDAATAYGGQFRGSARPSIEDWIDTDGPMLVGQELVTVSTTPVYREGRLVPRPMTVRVTASRTDQGWSFMPGGYARIGPMQDATALAMQMGGSVADVWVVNDQPVPAENFLSGSNPQQVRGEALPSRAAENLFWLGRYVERVESALRLVRAYHLRLAETGDPEDARLIMLRDFLVGIGISLEKPVPDAISNLVGLANGCASNVRDRFSADGWAALQDLDRTIRDMQRSAQRGDGAARSMGVLLRKITGFSGLVHENMYRFSAWNFLAFGRALERADTLASALAVFAAPDAPGGAADIAVELADSSMTHRRLYRGEASSDSAIDLVALDPHNPRALLFQIEEMLRLAPLFEPRRPLNRPTRVMRLLLPVQSQLTVTLPSDITPEFLQKMRVELARSSDELSAFYLR